MYVLAMNEVPVYERRVQFADADLAGIVHFTTILRYVEEAEHAAMENMGVPAVSAAGGFPKVHVDCDYRSPLRFGDVAKISLCVEKVSAKSVRWKFLIHVSELLSAEGSLVTAYVTQDGVGAEIPNAQRSLLEAHVCSLTKE